MADDIAILDAASASRTVATDEVAGRNYQLIKVAFGSDGSAQMVDASNGLPISGTLAISGGTVTLSGTSAVSLVAGTSGTVGAVSIAAGVAQIGTVNGSTVSLSGTSIISGAVTISDGSGPVTVDGTVALAGTSVITGAVTGPLTNAELRASPPNVGMIGDDADYWPGYSGVAAGTDRALIDPSGALIVRGAVTTDEGTFRVNFANSSLAVSIGSVTISGSTVTGTGFLTTDVHYNDFFKVDADGESSWTQISSIDSDTQLTLTSAYAGSVSGASSRALIKPTTGSGGSISVASGQLTISSGATNSALTQVARLVDFAPLVYRARFSISQRIANQNIYSGLSENSATPRWFARFNFNGATSTVAVCETGRNPTGAPSASEAEQTTITLPNGLTTATLNDYRVEMLTESARFYVAGVLVAEHSKVLPSQHDRMGAMLTVLNGTGATTTSVVADFVTGKNHNKLEVGIMSDAEKVVGSSAPGVTFTGSVAANNTDFFIIDCLQIKQVLLQVSSIGGGGTISWQASNDPTFAATIAVPAVPSAGGATATTTTAVGHWVLPVVGRYLRVRTTAYTSGTLTANALALQQPVFGPLPTQPVSGTVALSANTPVLAAGANLAGDFSLQYRAGATGAASATHLIAAGSTNATVVKASAGKVLGWSLFNAAAAARFVKLHNQTTTPTAGTGVVRTIAIPAGGLAQFHLEAGVAFATGIALTTVTGSADSDTTAVTAGDIIGEIFFA